MQVGGLYAARVILDSDINVWNLLRMPKLGRCVEVFEGVFYGMITICILPNLGNWIERRIFRWVCLDADNKINRIDL